MSPTLDDHTTLPTASGLPEPGEPPSVPEIHTLDVWNLHARADRVAAAAGAWRAIAGTIRAAADGVNSASAKVLSGDWRGVTAQTYDAHRLALVADLDRSGELATAAGAVLDNATAIVDAAQRRLTGEWTEASSCP